MRDDEFEWDDQLAGETAAAADPDAQPIPPERLTRMGRPLAKVVRHKLKLSLDEFATAYGIPRSVLLARERSEAIPLRPRPPTCGSSSASLSWRGRCRHN